MSAVYDQSRASPEMSAVYDQSRASTEMSAVYDQSKASPEMSAVYDQSRASTEMSAISYAIRADLKLNMSSTINIRCYCCAILIKSNVKVSTTCTSIETSCKPSNPTCTRACRT